MEMKKEDMPPEHIWLNPEALEDHFERLEEKYRSGDDGDDDEAPLDRNELTADLRKELRKGRR